MIKVRQHRSEAGRILMLVERPAPPARIFTDNVQSLTFSNPFRISPIVQLPESEVWNPNKQTP
jgi:hypothetical protein